MSGILEASSRPTTVSPSCNVQKVNQLNAKNMIIRLRGCRVSTPCFLPSVARRDLARVAVSVLNIELNCLGLLSYFFQSHCTNAR